MRRTRKGDSFILWLSLLPWISSAFGGIDAMEMSVLNDISQYTGLPRLTEQNRLYSTVVLDSYENSFCIINDDIYHVHDRVGKFTIIKIDSIGIELKDGDEIFSIHISGIIPHD